MNLLAQFKKENASIINSNACVLLAISGGVDSMVMLDLCLKCNIKIAVAHCNFGLRGSESDGDEAFVTSKAQLLGIACHVKKYNTVTFANTNRISIQEAARNLRYAFFESLANEHCYQKILIAHHKTDSVETVLINLLRGTGAKGLSGIKKQRNNIYRPLLFATRTSIETYAKANCIEHIEDSSNKKDGYLRNNIRHHLLPTIEKIAPYGLQKISENSSIINKEVDTLEYFLTHWCANYLEITDNDIVLKTKHLVGLPHPSLIIKHILKPENFDINEIEKFMQASTGATFKTLRYDVLKNRDEIVFKHNTSKTADSVMQIDNVNVPNSNFVFETMARSSNFIIDKNNKIALLDWDKIMFPLTFRNWQHGDYFYPLGMKNKKLISDFLINNKVSLFDKEKVKVLVSNNKIIWVVGMRIDNRFAVTDATQNILKIQMV